MARMRMNMANVDAHNFGCQRSVPLIAVISSAMARKFPSGKGFS
jgi:hypothetical protein